jgi:uncharacterized membrane protein
MKQVREFVTSSVLSGLLLAVPLYLAVLLLLKAMGSVVHLVQPIAQLLPRWSHAEDVLAILIVLFLCFLIGVALRTASGEAVGERIEGSVLVRIPGYLLLRSLTKQLAGESEESAWKPALVEIEDALVPAFIIEEFEDGRYTIFVPSSPSPFTGAVYILARERVHLLDASLAQTIQAVSRWGSGSRDLVAAMKPSTRRAAGGP